LLALTKNTVDNSLLQNKYIYVIIKEKEFYMQNKNVLSKLNLIIGIIYIITAVLAFFGEIISINIYSQSVTDNTIGLAAIVVILFGIYGGIPLSLVGVYNIVSGAVCKKTLSLKLYRTLAIISIITKISASLYLIYYFMLMLEAYPAGIILKAIYLLVSALGLVTAVLDVISLCKKTPKTEEIIVEE
jgi:hypothetical protein